MRCHLAAERGSALVTALLLTMIMLTVGLAGLAQVDVQQEQSGAERIGETAFNVGEGALGAQIFPLAQRWPGPGAPTAPSSAGLIFGLCTEASSSSNCPSAQTIAELFVSPDVESLTAWRTEVRDNNNGALTTCTGTGASPTMFYSDAFTAGQPPYDCNADGRLWVRAQATVRGRTRAMVALVQAERINHQLPRAALLAGRMEISNAGNKGIIDARAGTALNTGILLRCQAPDSASRCAGHQGTLDRLWSPGAPHLQTQLNGTKPRLGYAEAPALAPDALAELERAAITNGTWYANCPADPAQLAGEIVWVETCNKSYTGNTTINSPQAPGALIIEKGTIEFKGNIAFHGLLYHANVAPSSSENLVRLSGNNGVTGAVFVEGDGGFYIQGSAYLKVEGRPFDALRSYGSAGIIQNTWREIPPAP